MPTLAVCEDAACEAGALGPIRWDQSGSIATIEPSGATLEAGRRSPTVLFGSDDRINKMATDGRSPWAVGSGARRVGEPCTFHDLRHTHAALLIAQGEHPKVIQERLGHASIKTTLDTYGHLFDGLDEAAAVRLNATWRGSRVDAVWTQRERKGIEPPTR